MCYESVPTQDDVKKLKANMGVSKATLLTSVSAQLQATPYWVSMMELYLQRAPAMVEHGPKVVAMEKLLTKTFLEKCPLSCVPALIPVAKDLPLFQRAMLPGCVNKCLSLFRSCVSNVWENAKQCENASVQQLTDLSHLVTETSALWPQDSEVQGWVLEAGTLLAKSGEASMAKKILEGLHAVTSASTEPMETFTKSVQSFMEVIANATLPKALLVKDGEGPWVELAQKCGDVIVAKLPSDPQGPCEFFSLIADCLSRVGGLLPSSDVATVGLVLQAFKEMLSSQGELLEISGKKEPDTAEILRCTLNLSRKAAKFEQSFDAELEVLKHACYDKLWSVLEMLKKLVTSNQEKLVNVCHAKLYDMVQALTEMAQGAPAGASWLAGFKGEDFETFAAHAQLSLLTMPGEQIVNAQAAVSKACGLGVWELTLMDRCHRDDQKY